MAFAESRRYEFNEWDRDLTRYWAYPPHFLSEIATIPATALSAIPPLAFIAFPGRAKDAGADHVNLAPASSKWTVWAPLSVRWIATLSGMSKESASRALESLREHGLCQTARIPRPKHMGGFQTVLRLSTRLFAESGSPTIQIPGRLVFAGTWMLLPTHATRSIYLAVACLNTVRNPEALARALENAGVPDWEDEVEERQKVTPVSLSLLQGATGYQRSTIIEALSFLTHPIFGKGNDRFGLVGQSRAKGSRAYSYWIEHRAPDWHFPPDALNVSAQKLQELRESVWPSLATKRMERAQSRKKRKLAARIRSGLRVAV